jgi:signal transduction histidine kinase
LPLTSLKRNKYTYLSWKGILGTLVIVLISITKSYSQKKLTDSLLRKKANYENLPGFAATDTNYIKTLYQLSRSYIYQIPDSTKSISERVIELSKKAGFEKGVAGGKLGVGTYAIFKGDFEKGFEFLEEGIIKAKKTNADTLLLKGINMKAMGQFMKGNYPEAYLECKEGEAQAEEVGNLEMQVFFSMNLATCFAILRDYEQALPYYQKALQSVEKTNDKGQKAQIESNLGYLYLHTENYEKAKAFCNRAIPVLNEEKQQAWESFAWATLGEVAIKEKKYDEALRYFSRSEALLMTIEDMQRKAETSQGIADTYYLKGDITQSLEYAKVAEKISNDINYHNGIVKSSELLYKLSLERNKPQQALDYLRTAKHLSDSILESENRTKFLMLETQNKFNREKKLTEFENEKKLAKQKTITYVSVILLLALLIIVFLIRKNAQNQKKANLSLKQLNDTKDKLFSIIGHDLKAPISTLQELLELYSAKEISEEEVAQLAPRLKQNVDHSSFTLNNLLFWAKTQMNGIRPQIEAVSVKERTSLVCDLYQTIIKTKNISIKCEINPHLKIMADPLHVDIILRNVISNAIKYSKKDSAIILDWKKNGGNRAAISICDQGMGMNKHTIESIFRGEISNSTKGTSEEKGTGIGLQIVQELIEINNGKFNLKSEPQKGTCVFLEFDT